MSVPALESIVSRRSALLAALTVSGLAALPGRSSGAAVGVKPATMTNGLHDFAFQTGSWTVRHRKLVERLAGSDNWDEFDGTCEGFELMGGAANIDDHVINAPGGAYRAATFRRLDQQSGDWLIWWSDGRYPAALDPPLRGRFEHGVGTFFGEDSWKGTPIVVRFIWSGISRRAARWEQAFSSDNGRTWEVNWVMDFRRWN